MFRYTPYVAFMLHIHLPPPRASTKEREVAVSVAAEEEESCQTKDKEGTDGAGVTVKIGEDGNEGGADGEAEGAKRGEGEGEGDDEPLFFSVSEVRRRLSQHITAPRRTFERDPDDPSGEETLFQIVIESIHLNQLYYFNSHRERYLKT